LDARLEKTYVMGHIPNSENIPFSDVLNSDKTFKKKDELIELFKKKGLADPTKDKIVVSC
jgi:3-mercaptopyruvate sulfurtransferase SseA